MRILQTFKSWTKRTYKPKQAPWKRKILFLLSVLILVGTCIAAYTQINYNWTNNGIWVLIIPFHIISIFGLYVSLCKDDLWVALFLGKL